MPAKIPSADPRTEYTERLEARESVVSRYNQLHVRLGNIKLAVAAAVAGTAWLAFSAGMVSGWWLLGPGLVFVALAVWHGRVLRERALAGRAVRFYRRGLDRLDHKLTGDTETGERFQNEAHPYGADLDQYREVYRELIELMPVVMARLSGAA